MSIIEKGDRSNLDSFLSGWGKDFRSKNDKKRKPEKTPVCGILPSISSLEPVFLGGGWFRSWPPLGDPLDGGNSKASGDKGKKLLSETFRKPFRSRTTPRLYRSTFFEHEILLSNNPSYVPCPLFLPSISYSPQCLDENPSFTAPICR